MLPHTPPSSPCCRSFPRGYAPFGEHMHYALAITVLAIWGLTSFIPGTSGVNDSVFGFIYLFILISAHKWYMKPFTLKQTWLMTGTGLGFFLLYTCASVMLSLFGIDKASSSPDRSSCPSSWWASTCFYCSTGFPSAAGSSTA